MRCTLDQLTLYPVKSMRGLSLDRAEIEPCGLAGDRRWLVTDPTGRFLTQRDTPALATMDATPAPAGLTLRIADDSCPVSRPTDDVPPIPVTIWGDIVPARPASDPVAAWLSNRLGRPCRLVFLHDPAARPVDPGYGIPGDIVSFADGYPLLVASASSLDALNARLSNDPVPMDRFRPNLVVSGLPAWAEDRWQRVRIGAMRFRAAKPCTRCIVVTRDQRTGDIPKPGEPLRTLGRLNRHPSGIVFGMNLIPEAPGWLSVGDPVDVESEVRSAT